MDPAIPDRLPLDSHQSVEFTKTSGSEIVYSSLLFAAVIRVALGHDMAFTGCGKWG